MRRPILGTGFPKKAPIVPSMATPADLNACLTLLDLRSLPPDLQSRVYLVTAYVLVYPTSDDPIPVPIAGPSVLGVVQENTDGYIMGVAAASLDASPKPVKILDRFPMRGPMRVVLGDVTVGVSNVRVFGYYELEGDIVDFQGERPLQPTNALSAPFFGGSQFFENGIFGPVHALQEGYIDTITFNYNAQPGEPGVLRLQGELDLTLYRNITDPVPILLFDGIPMRASQPLMAAGFIGEGVGGLMVWGTFKRT